MFSSPPFFLMCVQCRKKLAKGNGCTVLSFCGLLCMVYASREHSCGNKVCALHVTCP